MHERAAFLAANGGEVPPPTESSMMQARKKKMRRPHIKTHGKISFTELTKMIVKKWKETPPEEKKLYQELARKDLARYQREYKEYKKKLHLAAQLDQKREPSENAALACCKKKQDLLREGGKCVLSQNENLPEKVESSSAPLPPIMSHSSIGLGLPSGMPQSLFDHRQRVERARLMDSLGHGYPFLGLNLVPIPYIIPSEARYYLPLLGSLPAPHLVVRPSSGNAYNSGSVNMERHYP